MEGDVPIDTHVSDAARPTPLGYVDHSRFVGFASELVFGKREDGKLVHIADVESGLACDCRCPACDASLIARKGKILAPHFAHAGDGKGCGTGAETNAHIWAKQVLEREKYILLPEVVARSGTLADRMHRPRIFRFAKVRLEHRLGDIVPDVLLETESGQELLVEVLVTHACDEEKIAKIHGRGLATVEVDLSAFRFSNDRARIEAALLRDADRAWLFNRKIAEREVTLADEERQRTAEAEARERKRLADAEEKAERAFKSAVDTLLRANRLGHNASNKRGKSEQDWLEDAGHADLFLPVSKVAGFLVPAMRWQAIVIERILGFAALDLPMDPRFTAATFLRGLDDVIAKPFRYEISADVERAFRESSGAEKLPFEAIEALLNHLCGERILSREGSHYGYSYEYARKVSNERAAQAETQMRQRAVDRAMRRIMFAIRADPQGAFDIEHWKRAPIPPFGTTLDALIDTEHGMWQRFETALSAIETMVDGGKPVQETLGLPIDAAIDRANAAEKARLAVGADDRIEHLRARAEYHLGPDAEIWLEAKGASGVSPLDAARAGVPSMETLLSQVGEAGRERILRLRVEAERRKLSDAAERVLGVRTAAFFLDNMEPKLGMSPRKFCKDAVTRARCMVMLEEWVARDKRNRRR